MRYPVTIEKEAGTYVATISHPDGVFQGACEGESRAEALAASEELLIAMISAAMRAGQPVPLPEECDDGNDWVWVNLNVAVKTYLHNTMLARHIRKAELARRLKVDQKQVDRILNPGHRSSTAQLEAAARVLGQHIDVRMSV